MDLDNLQDKKYLHDTYISGLYYSIYVFTKMVIM